MSFLFTILAWLIVVAAGIFGVGSCDRSLCKVGCVVAALMAILGVSLGALDILAIAWNLSFGGGGVHESEYPCVLTGSVFVAIAIVAYLLFLALDKGRE
jgi:hypothetical protein